jgi:hypothetical protein
MKPSNVALVLLKLMRKILIPTILRFRERVQSVLEKRKKRRDERGNRLLKDGIILLLSKFMKYYHHNPCCCDPLPELLSPLASSPPTPL